MDQLEEGHLAIVQVVQPLESRDEADDSGPRKEEDLMVFVMDSLAATEDHCKAVEFLRRQLETVAQLVEEGVPDESDQMLE